MRSSSWALYLAVRTLRWQVLRTVVACVSVAIGVASFGVAGILGQAQISQLVRSVEHNEGRPVTILIDPQMEMSDQDADTLESMIRRLIGISPTLSRFERAGTLTVCNLDGKQPRSLDVLLGGGQFAQMFGVSFDPRQEGAVLASGSLAPDATYAVCGSPLREVRIVPVTKGGRLPEFENAAIVPSRTTFTRSTIVPAGSGHHFWVGLVEPPNGARLVPALTSLVSSWKQTRGLTQSDSDVRRIDTAWRYAKNVGTTTLVLRVISAILLLTGVLGLTNVQLVLLRQRVASLALLKAFGARTLELGLVLMLESIAIALFGGLLGLTLALGSVFILHALLGQLGPLTISPAPLGLAILAAFLAGIVSGLLPAARARKLDISLALRQ